MKIKFVLPILALFSLIGCQAPQVVNLDEHNKSIAALTEQNNNLTQKVEELSKDLDLLTSEQRATKGFCQNDVQSLNKANENLRKEFKELFAVCKSANKVVYKPEEKVETTKDNTKLEDGKMIFGNVEWVYVVKANTSFESRIDTGASVSSISAINIEPFEREGAKWYRFEIPLNKNETIKMEAPWVRTTKIKQASSDGELEERPIVKLAVKVGELTETAEFSLRNRTNMQYVVLIGREFLNDIAVVDVSRQFVQKKIENTSEVGALKQDKEKNFIPDSRDFNLKENDKATIPAKIKKEPEEVVHTKAKADKKKK